MLILAICVAAVGLFLRAWYEVSSGVLAGDAFIFQTVGRGIVNGLKPYADLFETKPPGIFLLFALSLKFFGDQTLVKLLQAAVLLGIPVLVFLPSLHIVAQRPARQRQWLSLLSLLFGLLLALYTANQAGQGLPESFGAFFAIAFLAAFIFGYRFPISDFRSPLIHSLLLGVLLLCSLGFKEPFFLSILAGVVLLSDDDQSFIRQLVSSFLIPAAIALALGLFALAVLGYLGPFFSVYLPHMLGYHIQQYHGSTMIHALEIWRTFRNMGAYSWWFAVAVTLVWVGVFVRFVVLSSWFLVLRWVVASYLMFLAIGIGGDFYGHHFIFAVPVYAALWWAMLRHLPERIPKFATAALAILLTLTAFFSTQFSYAKSAAQWKEKEEGMQTAALAIDTLMQQCEWNRYLQMIPRGVGPYAYTKASPYGPIFTQYERFIGASKSYQTQYLRALKEAPFMLLIDIKKSNLSVFAKQYVGVHYVPDPPACAGENFSLPEPYNLLFRQEK